MHLYREDGQAVGDTSVIDMELFDLGGEGAQRMGEILKVAEPLRYTPSEGKERRVTNMVMATGELMKRLLPLLLSACHSSGLPQVRCNVSSEGSR